MPEKIQISRRHFVASAVTTAAWAALPLSIAQTQSQHKKGNQMANLTPYLLFDAKCREAMEFYQSCFGGELTLLKVKDSPARDHMPTVQQDKVLNARLRSGNLEISASDWLMPNRTPVRGNTVCLYSQRRDTPGIEGPVRETFGRSRCDRSLEPNFLWHVWSAQRQIRRPLDVPNQRESLNTSNVKQCTQSGAET